VKVLVISDLHAMSEDLLKVCESSNLKGGKIEGGYNGSTRGLYFVEDRSPRKNRVLALKEAIEKSPHVGQIDALVCLGDIAHQCKRAVALAAWRDIADVAADLGIEEVIAVPGNHDVAAHDVDFARGAPSAFLEDIRPLFPHKDCAISKKFHSEQFACFERDNVLMAIVNTCSLIGYGGGAKEDLFRKGFISEKVLDGLISEVSKTTCASVLVAMHHHPIPVHETQDQQDDFIEAGAELIVRLQGTGKPSIILHGHKHFVNFKAANNGPNAPWILSSSSLGAKPYDGFEENYSCQFHVVELSTSLGNDNSLRGRIWSWDWVVTAWQPARTNGLPAQTGFSDSIDLRAIAVKVRSLVEGGGSINGEKAKGQVPDLDFLTREQLTELKSMLQNEYKVRMIADGGNATLSFWEEE
jgi:3',5'-cyclic AMP phosphodiesterase CpdA